MSKVTVVGAGNVGATCANVLAVNEVANEVCLIDIKEGFAEGKAMDIMQTAQLMGFDTVVTGVTNDYSKTSGSDVVIITSGLPRKPGMTREELIGVNAYPRCCIQPDGHHGLSDAARSEAAAQPRDRYGWRAR